MGEIEFQWEKFIYNQFYVMSSTAGYLWLDLSIVKNNTMLYKLMLVFFLSVDFIECGTLGFS